MHKWEIPSRKRYLARSSRLHVNWRTAVGPATDFEASYSRFRAAVRRVDAASAFFRGSIRVLKGVFSALLNTF
jgi:hypothetical protein